MNIKDSAKTILCYGDSNTWGDTPEDIGRHPRSVRWPSVLQNLLGGDYEVISEGLSGRTLVAIDPAKPHRTGITHLQVLLESHKPLDAILIMLGTNDAKNTYGLTAEDIASHLEQTINLIQDGKVDLQKKPLIFVICPPKPINPTAREIDPRMTRAFEIFEKLPALYKEVAERHRCRYLNSGEYISSSKVDGYHLDASAHMRLAEVLRDTIRSVLT